MSDKYELDWYLGSGSYGTVMRATCKRTKKIVAIKHVSNVFKNEYYAKKTLREIQLLKLFAEDPTNIHTSKLVEVIIPGVCKHDLQQH